MIENGKCVGKNRSQHNKSRCFNEMRVSMDEEIFHLIPVSTEQWSYVGDLHDDPQIIAANLMITQISHSFALHKLVLQALDVARIAFVAAVCACRLSAHCLTVRQWNKRIEFH